MSDQQEADKAVAEAITDDLETQQAENQPDEVVEVLEGEIVVEETTDTDAMDGDPSVDNEETAVEVEEAISPEAALIAQLQAELAEARAEAAAQTDQAQRLAAEFQNSRKRQERQLADSIQRAGGHLATQLLPALDDFDLAFDNLPADLSEEDASWVDGFRQIYKKLAFILEEQGVTPIPPEGAFDPNLHEAISSEPNDEVESGHIIETLRAGYEYKGRVLRPAMVRVAM